VQRLSRRWLSYVASQFEVTDELLATLRQLVPARDYAVLLEDLMWRSALRADRTSFERGVRNQQGRGALERRAELLQPLAEGDVGRFSNTIRTGLRDAPSETLRFLDLLVQRLELEDADVRGAHARTLTQVRELVRPLTTDEGAGSSRVVRTATSLMERTQAILEGSGGLVTDAGGQDRARSLDPTGEVFAGSVRLAPADPLPWPFRLSDAPAPSINVPIELTPQEWRGDAGDWVYGWRLGG
jgi:hypothetical protein